MINGQQHSSRLATPFPIELLLRASVNNDANFGAGHFLAIYTSPRFRIKIPEGISDELDQEIGIRQGCPLSPYLYIIATSCQMTDLLRDIQDLEIELPRGARYPTLLFADDTLLLANKAAHMEQLLKLMIEHSIPYNLTLNKEKCQLLVTNDVGSRVNFPDGTPVSRQKQIKYLGATFTATLDVGSILRQKTTEASATMRALQPLWKDTQISTSWKLVIYNAVIRTRVFYTLETLELTPGQQRILDTLYFRGLRKILHKRSTFIDRYWTHERLLRLANLRTLFRAEYERKWQDLAKIGFFTILAAFVSLWLGMQRLCA